MPHVLEMKSGELITPMNLYDVLEVVEDYLGTDIRQYLEEYIDNAEVAQAEDVDLDEHYRDVLENLEFKVREIEIAVSGKRTDRKGIVATTEVMRKMIDRELSRGK